jgi:hypothetical protein
MSKTNKAKKTQKVMIRLGGNFVFEVVRYEGNKVVIRDPRFKDASYLVVDRKRIVKV